MEGTVHNEWSRLCFMFSCSTVSNCSLVNLRLLASEDVFPLCSSKAPKTEQQHISIPSPEPWSHGDVTERCVGLRGPQHRLWSLQNTQESHNIVPLLTRSPPCVVLTQTCSLQLCDPLHPVCCACMFTSLHRAFLFPSDLRSRCHHKVTLH